MKVATYPSRKEIVLVTGDRWWNDRVAILKVLKALPPHTIVIHGFASGADSFADLCAAELGMPVCRVPYFGAFHRAGGSIRNTFMLHILHGLRLQGWTITILAFHDRLAESKGTKDMLAKAEAAEFRVRVFKHKIPWAKNASSA